MDKVDIKKQFRCISCGEPVEWISQYQILMYTELGMKMFKPLCKDCYEYWQTKP